MPAHRPDHARSSHAAPDGLALRRAIRTGLCVGTLALVSACATQPQLSAQQESGQYRSRAGRNYTPPGPASDPWGPYIVEAAAKFDVPDLWVREVMRQESGGKLYHGGTLVTSGAGAMGLMQVMPATYDEIRVRYPELGSDPYDPHNNILAGTAYIREMYDIYGSPGFLAAYNAGPGRLDDYLTRNRTLPEETRRYVAAIGPRIASAAPRTPSPGAQFAMNATPFSIPDGPRYASNARYSAPAGAPIVLSPAPAFAQSAPRYSPAYSPAAPIQLAAAAPIGSSGGNYIKLRPPGVTSTPLAAPAAEPAQFAEAAPLPLPIIVPTPDANFRPVSDAEHAAQVAQAQAAAQADAPAQLADAAPYAPPAYAPATYKPATYSQVPEPPRYTPAPSQQYAMLPVPPTFREAPRSQQQMAAAALVPVSPRGGFSLFSPANAAPIGLGHGPSGSGGAWAVQVGAFANEGLASSAALTARDHARDVLGGARSNVTAVRQPHGILYRARLTGLSRDAAAQACERLARARTNCMVVSPDAQS